MCGHTAVYGLFLDNLPQPHITVTVLFNSRKAVQGMGLILFSVKRTFVPCYCYSTCDLKICPEAETIPPEMTICPLDKQALFGENCLANVTFLCKLISK